MVDLGLVAVPDGEDILFGAGILLCEKHHVVLVRIFGGIDLVGAFVDDRFGGLGGFFQIIGVVVSLEVDAVVFAVGSLEEAEPRFQRQCRPFVDAVGRHLLGQTAAVDGEVDILDHLGHDQLPRIARLVEVGIRRSELCVVPGHVAETFHLVEIEGGAEEPGQGGIFEHSVLVFALVDIFQQGVYAAQVAPRPAAAGVGNGAFVASVEDIGEGHLNEQVVLLIVGRLVQQVVVKGVGEEFQVAFRLEIVELRHPIQRFFVQQGVAGR